MDVGQPRSCWRRKHTPQRGLEQPLHLLGRGVARNGELCKPLELGAVVWSRSRVTTRSGKRDAALTGRPVERERGNTRPSRPAGTRSASGRYRCHRNPAARRPPARSRPPRPGSASPPSKPGHHRVGMRPAGGRSPAGPPGPDPRANQRQRQTVPRVSWKRRPRHRGQGPSRGTSSGLKALDARRLMVLLAESRTGRPWRHRQA